MVEKFKNMTRKKKLLLTKKHLEKIKLQKIRVPKILLIKKFLSKKRTNLMKHPMTSLSRNPNQLKRRRNLTIKLLKTLTLLRKRNQKNQKSILAKRIIK
jgi:hypothetical protein